MSRSRRKTPITGHTTARSEAQDKRQWHQRWRARERERLARVGPGDDHVSVDRRAVSNTWAMAKDGKQWFGPRQQRRVAARLAPEGPQRVRLLAKWRAK